MKSEKNYNDLPLSQITTHRVFNIRVIRSCNAVPGRHVGGGICCCTGSRSGRMSWNFCFVVATTQFWHDDCCPMATTMDVVMILMLKIITQRVRSPGDLKMQDEVESNCKKLFVALKYLKFARILRNKVIHICRLK